MGIFAVSTKDNWDAVEEALKSWRKDRDVGDSDPAYYEKNAEGKTPSRVRWDQMEAEVMEALEGVRFPKQQLWNQISKLVMANNVDRALKLIKAARQNDLQLRWPVALVINIVLLPFRLILWFIKLIAP